MKNKILLVEDDDVILIILKFFLERKNYEVLTANNGKSALEIYNDQPVLVVITNLHMPVMDGIELIDNLLAFPNKPVILIHSDASDMQIIIELMQKGVYDYLLKPPNFPELILRVDKAYEVAELRIIKENRDKGDCFEVSKSTINFLFENASNAKHAITVMEENDKIQSLERKLEWITISELHGVLAKIYEKMYGVEKLNDIKFSKPSSKIYILIELKHSKIIGKHQGHNNAFNLVGYLGFETAENLETCLNFEIEAPVKE